MKCVLLDDAGNLVFKQYQRHYSQIPETALSLLSQLKPYLPDGLFTFSVSGSAGMGMAQNLSMPFVQEVYATRTAILAYLPGSDVVIELGGEDAKILFLKGIWK
jgi:activator of 2-hydroxyglutaryl-CoA dehydratase